MTFCEHGQETGSDSDRVPSQHQLVSCQGYDTFYIFYCSGRRKHFHVRCVCTFYGACSLIMMLLV